MTTRVYLDTSALIKEFVEEKGSDLVDKLGVAAKEGKCQLIKSVWSINEAIAVMDRLSCKEKDPLSKVEKQQIIATLADRIMDSGEHSSFKMAPLEHRIIANSRVLIDRLHISPDDAVHLYTAFIFDCKYFVLHDDKLVNRAKNDPIEGLRIIDLANDDDCRYLIRQLAL